MAILPDSSTEEGHRCSWCGRRFEPTPGPGRPRLYCRPSHRQRAYEARSLVVRLGERQQWVDQQAAANEQAELTSRVVDDLRAVVELGKYDHQPGAEAEPVGPVTYLGVQCSPPPASLVKQLKLASGMGLLVDEVLEQLLTRPPRAEGV